ncbi:hypothetical protein VP01_972g1 [Puccinia sorghi]|uniref:Uncharacterized protein n=1 Tax=Puccinia sorghi TaxID=27349 RepID=A0A0L6U811_9BASI|nr:hypothetical protein VP01_972g1 [Puccinia sorghi]
MTSISQLNLVVIDLILCDEFMKFQDQITRQIKFLGHFKEIHFTRANWMKIKHFNNELKPFNLLTKEMEGDGPTGAFVLVYYFQKIKDLKKKEESGDQENAFHPIFCDNCCPEETQQAKSLLEMLNKQEASLKRIQDDIKLLEKQDQLQRIKIAINMVEVILLILTSYTYPDINLCLSLYYRKIPGHSLSYHPWKKNT